MSQATAYEQLMLELVNAERAKTGAQPLAFNGNLNDAADGHNNWMIATDTFSHTGAGGSSPTARMTQAGYSFAGSWASGENIAWASTRAPSGLQDEVQLLHTNLMNSPGHKANILNGTYQEIGVGFTSGEFQGWDAAFVTEDFARAGNKEFLTGVAIKDRDGDHFYDIGEGLAGLTVTAVGSNGASTTTTTQAAGGYSLALTPGTYKVTFSGGGLAPVSKQVTIGSANVKVDLVNPAATPSAATASKITGTTGDNKLVGTSDDNVIDGAAGNDKLYGQAGDDKLYGRAGNDMLTGNAGNDRLYGGSGNDKLYGSAGNDTLTGGSGADSFRFRDAWGADKITDFHNAVDHIDLRGTGLHFGDLSITRINADGDGVADDVMIQAHGQSITLLNVKMSLIGASDFLF